MITKELATTINVGVAVFYEPPPGMAAIDRVVHRLVEIAFPSSLEGVTARARQAYSKTNQAIADIGSAIDIVA